MSKFKINETENKNSEKKEEFGIKDYHVWKHKVGLVSDNIIDSLIKNQSKIKNYTESLNERELKDRKKIKSFTSTDKLKEKKDDGILVSDTVKKIMGDVGKLVMNMKTQEENLSRTNINALLETTNQIKKSEIIDEPNIILKKKEKEYKLSLERKLKKPPNYKFLSDSYRRQVNKAFMDYNPIIHLGNIHMLRKTDPEIDKQFKSHIQEIDDELKNSKGFIYYNDNLDRNKNKFRLKQKKSIEEQDITNNNFMNNKLNGNTGYTAPTATTMTFSDGRNTVNYSKNKRNLFNKRTKHKKQEKKIKFPDKETREIELNLMKNVCEQIDLSISPKTINNYFRNYKELKNTDLELQRHTFFGNINNAHKILTEIKETLHIKKMEEDIKKKKKQSSVDCDNLVDKINILKDSLLLEIDEQEKKQNKIYNK